MSYYSGSDTEAMSSDEGNDADDLSDADVLREVLSTKSPEDLATLARRINSARTGEPDSRNTQALFRTKSATRLSTQRSYKEHEEELDAIFTEHGIEITTTVIGDQGIDEGIHAEMLAVSKWLTGEASRPTHIGVSQKVCSRCSEVLTILDIEHSESSDKGTQNWVHPFRHAGIVQYRDVDTDAGLTKEEFAALKALPQKVTKNKAYGWK